MEQVPLPVRLSDTQRLQVSKLEASTIRSFHLGVQLGASTHPSIDSLVKRACKDRFKLASRFLRSARSSAKQPSPDYRLVVGRAYYAMYHATRAVVYHDVRGDDHEAHSDLPRVIPRGFPSRTTWENELKSARLERNKADYDPYPANDAAFAGSAAALLRSAATYLRVARQYLKVNGCKV